MATVTTTKRDQDEVGYAVSSRIGGSELSGAELMYTYLDRNSVAALRGDDTVLHVVVDLVVVDGQEVAVVVGVEAVRCVVVHLVPPPVSLLVAVRVDSEVIVVDVGVVDVAVDVDFVEHVWVTQVLAEPSHLLGCMIG